MNIFYFFLLNKKTVSPLRERIKRKRRIKANEQESLSREDPEGLLLLFYILFFLKKECKKNKERGAPQTGIGERRICSAEARCKKVNSPEHPGGLIKIRPAPEFNGIYGMKRVLPGFGVFSFFPKQGLRRTVF